MRNLKSYVLGILASFASATGLRRKGERGRRRGEGKEWGGRRGEGEKETACGLAKRTSTASTFLSLTSCEPRVKRLFPRRGFAAVSLCVSVSSTGAPHPPMWKKLFDCCWKSGNN